MKEIISRNEGLHRHTNESSYKERTDDRRTNIEKVKHGGERCEERRGEEGEEVQTLETLGRPCGCL